MRYWLSIRNFLFYWREWSPCGASVAMLENSNDPDGVKAALTDILLSRVGLTCFDGRPTAGIYLTRLQKSWVATMEAQGFSVKVK